jgi:hypothetical protein
MNRLFSAVALAVVISSSAAYAQQASLNPSQIDPKTTPAYSMLIQRKVKVQAELEGLLGEYDGEWPRAKQLKFEFDVLKIEMKKMTEVEESRLSKFTSGYGALILRKVALNAEIQMLLLEEGSDWPEVKQKQRELELLDKEIQKLMR